jgi:zinc D-Ala-D-Ala dipeptidase
MKSAMNPAKPYQKVTIQECGEPLLPIPLSAMAVVDPHPYMACGADYAGKSPYYLRSGVIDRLQQAQAYLEQIRPGYRLQIFDAYRPVEVQQYMVDYTFQEVCQTKQISQPTAIEAAAIWQQVYQIWAVPSFELATPPPHSTGAAIDLSIIDNQQQPLDMGSLIDEMSDRSQPNYFATESHGQLFHQNRELLRQVMETAEFQRHPGEWWHFSWGDQLWAWISQENNLMRSAVARYGRLVDS